jgi:hypothetical protein
MRRATGAREFLDRPVAAADLAATLADVERLSAWFGGYALSRRALARLADGAPRGRALVVADVGGGAGGFAAGLVRWARRRGWPVRVVIVDREGAVLDLARRRCAAHPGIALVQADATALPFRTGAVDVATCALTLHHLEPDAAARSLAEMRAAARLGVVVNDLLRTRLGLALVWVATRLFVRHPFARHDGPLSVRRAYAPAELRALAGQAGIGRLEVRAYPLLGRLIAIAT